MPEEHLLRNIEARHARAIRAIDDARLEDRPELFTETYRKRRLRGRVTETLLVIPL